jgi:malate synthase
MRTLYAFTTGVILTLIAATYLVPQQQTLTVTSTVDDRVYTQEIITTIDLEHIRDTRDADPQLDDSLNAECAYAIQRHTDEPLKGIINYIERYWSGDSCAAYEHLQNHDWY